MKGRTAPKTCYINYEKSLLRLFFLMFRNIAPLPYFRAIRRVFQEKVGLPELFKLIKLFIISAALFSFLIENTKTLRVVPYRRT